LVGRFQDVHPDDQPVLEPIAVANTRIGDEFAGACVVDYLMDVDCDAPVRLLGEALRFDRARDGGDYRLVKDLWAFDGDRIAVRFAYEWHDDSGNWFRSYGNENWEFDGDGLMRVRHASINDRRIGEEERLYHWPLGRRPDDHPGLSDLGL
jgi:hypothetical protein